VVQRSRRQEHQLGKQLRYSQGSRSLLQGLALELPARQPHSHQLGRRSGSCCLEELVGLVELVGLEELVGLVELGHRPLGMMAAWRFHTGRWCQ